MIIVQRCCVCVRLAITLIQAKLHFNLGQNRPSPNSTCRELYPHSNHFGIGPTWVGLTAQVTQLITSPTLVDPTWAVGLPSIFFRPNSSLNLLES